MRSPPISLSRLPKAPTRMEDDKAKVQDLLKEVNLGTINNPKPIFIGKLLLADTRQAFMNFFLHTKTASLGITHKCLGLIWT